MRLLTLTALTSTLLLSPLAAQSFEEYQRSQMQAYSKYKEERDQAFNQYLKQQWKEYRLFTGRLLYEKPKPKIVPKAEPVKVKPLGPKVVIKAPKLPETLKPVAVVEPPKQVEPKQPPKEPVTLPAKKPVKTVEPVVTPQKKEPSEAPQPVVTPEPVKAVTPPPPEKVTFVPVKKPLIPVEQKPVDPDAVTLKFFGTDVEITVPKNMRSVRLASVTQNGIAEYFDTLAMADYEKLLTSINAQKKSLKLNDWGNYLLLKSLSGRLYRPNSDEATLFTWFVLNKQGYAVKIGIAGSKPVLLVHSKKMIYSTPNYTFGKNKFYAVEYYAKKGVGSLRTYPQKYPGADKPFDMALKELPALDPDVENKSLKFRHRGAEYTVNVTYNKNLIDYMDTYPQADYETYFNAPMSEENRALLVRQLKPMLDGKQASSAINFLLFFVQNAFQYQVDQTQFGREKVMFADETLFYKYSDCEDRSVLFAYLIKDIFNVDVVGVRYKDHIATAIDVPLGGDAITVGKKRYVIADPTYINASAGMSMPQYKSVNPVSFIRVY
jgi:hypothetical protein